MQNALTQDIPGQTYHESLGVSVDPTALPPGFPDRRFANPNLEVTKGLV